MAGKTKLDLTKLRHLHQQGLHPKQIAQELGVSPDTVITQLDRDGLTWTRKAGGLPRSLTDAQEQALVGRYKAGEGATTLSRDFGTSKKTVYNILNKHGVGTRSVAARRAPATPRKARVSARDREITNLYRNGHSIPQIAANLKIHETSVRYGLRKQDQYQQGDTTLKVRQAPRKTKRVGSGNRDMPQDPVRHDAFEYQDEHTLYWIGFLLADGCVHHNTYGQPTICVNLKEADIEHLEKLKAWVGTNRKISHKTPITFGKQRRICSLFWRSAKQAKALQELGVVPHKEGRFVSPFVASAAAFWRGAVDGDGCIYAPNKGTTYLSGQPEILSPWAAFCADVCGVDDPVEVVRIYDRRSVSVGSIRRKGHCRAILKRLYGNASIYLDRKKAIADLWST